MKSLLKTPKKVLHRSSKTERVAFNRVNFYSRKRLVLSGEPTGIFGEPINRSSGYFGLPGTRDAEQISDLSVDQLGTADFVARIQLQESKTKAKIKELNRQLEDSKTQLAKTEAALHETEAAYALAKQIREDHESPRARLLKVLSMPQSEKILEALSVVPRNGLALETMVHCDHDLFVVCELTKLGHLALAERMVRLSSEGEKMLSKLALK